MKAVLISIHPRHCGNIANGKKTVEVRKTVPKIPTPFKCYIYMTKSGNNALEIIERNGNFYAYSIDYKMAGTVVGEFVCDRIDTIRDEGNGFIAGGVQQSERYSAAQTLIQAACLTEKEIKAYLGNDYGYCWHISDLKIYGKPKELGEFKKGCNDMDDPVFGSYCGYCEKGCFLTRPPQSWCYVEELEDDDEEAERIRADRLRDERRDEEALRQLEGEE